MDDPEKTKDPPSRSRCLELMDEFEMLSNIKAHSTKVSDISLLIAHALEDSGIEIEMKLVEAGALLHDITKTQSLGTKENHAETGEKLLIDLGYPKTAQVVGEHIISDDRGDELTPCEIVAYADKRVLHDKLVGLDERMTYLVETYGSSSKALAYYDKMRSSLNHIEKLVKTATGHEIDDLIS